MTRAYLVGRTDTWPYGDPFGLNVFPDPLPRREGFDITIWTDPVDEEKRSWVMSVGFSNLSQAERAGALLSEAFQAVREIASEDHPQPGDGHEHEIAEYRFDRRDPKQQMCNLCGAVLGTVDE
jgi:hypothetical protein